VPNVNVITPEGDSVSIPEDALGAALRSGYRRESAGEEILRTKHEAEIEPYEGVGGAVKAGVQGALRGATLGGSDWLQRLGGDSAQSLRLAKEAHPNVSLATEILGGVLPSVLSGGSSEAAALARFTPSGALSRGAQILGEGVSAGGGTARAITGATISGAVEGGVQNVGSYLSDVALGNKELSAEGVVGSLGQGALFGGGAAGGLAGIERGTIAARRMFPKLAGGGKEAAQIAEESFHAATDDVLKAGDDLEKVARDELSTLRIRRRELELEREKLRGLKDPASRVKAKEIALAQEQNKAALKAIRDAKNAERAAQGLPDLPPAVEAPPAAPIEAPPPSPDIPPANDVAPIQPANVNAPTGLEAQLLGTKHALDQGVPFTEIGKAENDLAVAADNAHHEAGMLADGAVDDAIADIDRKVQKVEDYAARKQSVRDYAAKLKAKANQAASGREISYRPLQAADEKLGLGASHRSGKVVTPVEGREAEAFASEQVFAGIGAKPKTNGLARDAGAAPARSIELSTDTGAANINPDNISALDLEVVGRPSAGMRSAVITMADGGVVRTVPMRADGIDKLVNDLMPSNFRSSTYADIRTPHFKFRRGVPKPDELTENTTYLFRPSELLDVPVLRGDDITDRLDSVRKGFSEGKKLPAIDIVVHPDGTYYVVDGNHRLFAKSSTDDLVSATFRPVSSKGTHFGVGETKERLREELQKGGVYKGAVEDVEQRASDLLPPGFSTGPLGEDVKVARGLPRPGETFNEEQIFVAKAGDLKRAGLHATDDSGFAQNRVDSIKDAWKKDRKLDPIKASFNKDGKIEIIDGRHRLAAAADDQELAIRLYPFSDDVGKEFGANGPRAEYLRVANAERPAKLHGADLDQAYEQAIEEAAKAATDDAQSAAVKRAAALEDRIMAEVEKRGGRDAERAAAIRKAREEIGWTSEQVAARRAEKRALADMNGPVTTGKADPALDAYDAAVRRSEEALGATQGERAKNMVKDLGWDVPGPFYRKELAGAGTKPSIADEILAGGREVDLRPHFAPPIETPSQGRLIDDASEGIKVIDDFEKAHHDLVQELGPAAPPAATAHAQEYATAVEDQARKQTESMAMHADSAAKVVSLPKPPKVQTALEGVMGSGVGKRAMDIAAGFELLRSVGDLPFVPDPSNLPVVGPLLSMYLKFRGMKAVFNRFGGRIPATAESKAAVRAAELRDKAAGVVDAILEGTGRAAKAARRGAPVAAVKAFEVLKHSQYPDGEERAEPKNAQEATRHRVAELSAAVSNPDAVRAAVRAQVPAANPDVTRAIEDATLRKLQYLQSKAPKEPPPGPFRTREWVPSKVEVERFARRVRAADDPVSVLEDIQNGTVTPEAAETLRAVYPQVFAEVQSRLITRSAELQVSLPHQKIVQMSLLFDAPLTPSLEPANLALLQQAHSSAMSMTAPQPGAPPTPSVAAPLNMSGLYETPDIRRDGRR